MISLLAPSGRFCSRWRTQRSGADLINRTRSEHGSKTSGGCADRIGSVVMRLCVWPVVEYLETSWPVKEPIVADLLVAGSMIGFGFPVLNKFDQAFCQRFSFQDACNLPPLAAVASGGSKNPASNSTTVTIVGGSVFEPVLLQNACQP